jgi:uncharacterized protein YndB with AHSA1/START domain
MTLPSDRAIAFTREFDAPRRLVFEAWTRAEHFRRWYGCRGSSMLSCEIDLRPGGAYRFVILAPDGNEYPMSGVYQEIVPPERLVYTECFNDDAGSEAVVTLTLKERDGRTTLAITAIYPTQRSRDAILKLGVERGTTETLDRLAEHLEALV